MSGVTANPSRTCVVLQPGYLPWLGYFEQVHRADVFVHLDDVQFDKHGWRNRNRIKGPGGPQWLTVPVCAGDGAAIKDVRIDATKANWAEKHLKTIQMNYGAAPFFDWLFPELSDVLRAPWDRIADLDIALVELLCAKLGLARQFRRSSEMILPQGRCERLITICESFACRRYYTGAASRAYMDLLMFRHAGIDVTFQDYHHPTYSQRYGAFVSHLSVIDLMFHRGPTSLDMIKAGGRRAEQENARSEPCTQTV